MLTVRLRQATLVRRDDVTATASGEVSLQGWLGDLAIVGEVQTDRVEVRLIDTLPPEVVQLDVVELGNGRAEDAAPEEEAGAFDATLDIAVEIPRRLFVRGRGLEDRKSTRLNSSH